MNCAALQAFCVEMRAAVTALANVLIHGAVALRTAKLAQNVAVAKLGKVAIDTALLFGGSVKRQAQLLGGELTVGVFCHKAAKRLFSVGKITFFRHDLPFLYTMRMILNIENSSQIIAQKAEVVKGFGEKQKKI